METLKFDGSLHVLPQDRNLPIEHFYTDCTHAAPCLYKITNLDIFALMHSFKLQFFALIEDFVVLDAPLKRANYSGYTLCFVLKNHIFVVFEEAAQQVKILYHKTKDETLKAVVQLCQSFKIPIQ